MTVENLDLLTQFTGFLSIFGTVTLFYFIIVIINKARRYHDKVLYAFALFLITLNSPWYPSGFCYVYWLFTKEVFTYDIYMILGNIGIPIVTLSWFYIYTNLVAQKSKTKIMIFLGVIFILFYFLLFFFILMPGSPKEMLIGILNNPFDSEYRGFVLIYIIFSFIVSDSTIFHFCYISIKESNSKITRWNGIFFAISTILYLVGALIDGFVILDLISLIIVRIIIFFAAILFYLGLLMPKFFKKLLKIDNDS